METVDPITEARRILASPPAHMILSTPEWRTLTHGLLGEIARLQRIANDRRTTTRRQNLPAPAGQAIVARVSGDRRKPAG